MERIDIGTESERIAARVKITGEYLGVPFEAETTNYYWVRNNNEPSRAWWEIGNMACDCNRVQFLLENLARHHDGECGDQITIFKIIPLEGDNLPILDLTIPEEIIND